ncbi:FtsX-like permease family protein [Nocardia terpenica]|uniref:FtsX-like permease family protein n=1 Tax=Nocardia terpenica TaxID=455432 RepID=UPI0018932650|nr:FtsX-like permease family protein [Nocardia terpenica]MBF6063883.1 FtsX-like permease family protein [Nocardia terpenica]MBF6121064.1 FtsX-like permease family protein [Nocardia terpenica]MBF6153394.1 FtsX-like permease family protein [Nocardia terpenica]
MIAAGWDRLRLFNIGELLIHRGRTLLSLVVMAVSAALLVSVFSLAGSVTGSVDRLTKSLGGKAALEVTGITDAGFDQQVLQQIRATPGVSAAVPMIRARIGADTDRALLVGADASVTALGSALDGPLRADAMKLVTVPNGVLVGAAMGHRAGETFRVGSGTVTVAGVLDDATSKRLNGGHIVVTQLPLAQRLLDRTGQLDSIQIVPAAKTDVGQLRSTLTQVVAGRAVVADPSLRTAQAGGAVMLVRYSTTVASAAALIVSGFLVYNAMSMAVAQRRPMLSLLRALGGRRRSMVRDLIAEAGVLGLIGGLAGALLGTVMGRTAIDRLPSAIVQSVEARTEYIVPGYAVPVAVAACVLASVAASAIAARQIYKVRPIEALAPVGVSRSDAVSPLLRRAAIVGGLVLVGASILLAEADIGRYSIVSISLAITAAVVLCFAATGPIVRAVAAVARLFGAPGALGATTVERAPRRVWATAMTVMIGVTAVVAMGSASENLADSAGTSFRSLGNSDLYVSPGAFTEFPTGPLLPPEVKDRIRVVPGVAGVESAQMAFATLGGGRVMLQGYEDDNHAYPTPLDDRARAGLVAGTGVVISRDIARSQGVHEGSTLSLPTPTGTRTVRVLRVIPYFSAIAGVVVMNIDIMREWYQRPGETILAVDFQHGADPSAVTAAIRAAVPPQLHVSPGSEAVAAISGGVRQGTALSNSILWIVVLVSTIALLNTLMLSVLERRREFGVLRAMGTSRRFLLRTVLTEAAGIGLVGAALGLAFGAAVQYLATVALGHAMTIDVAYKPSPMLLAYAVAALVLALLGSIPPSLRAARMPIVEAIAVD